MGITGITGTSFHLPDAKSNALHLYLDCLLNMNQLFQGN